MMTLLEATSTADIIKNLVTVFVVAILLGAGLPAIFATGMRATTLGRGVTPDGHESTGSMTLAGRVLSLLCFGVVVLAALVGIAFIVAGKVIMKHLGG